MKFKLWMEDRHETRFNAVDIEGESLETAVQNYAEGWDNDGVLTKTFELWSVEDEKGKVHKVRINAYSAVVYQAVKLIKN